jgi:hypothetical protein
MITKWRDSDIALPAPLTVHLKTPLAESETDDITCCFCLCSIAYDPVGCGSCTAMCCFNCVEESIKHSPRRLGARCACGRMISTPHKLTRERIKLEERVVLCPESGGSAGIGSACEWEGKGGLKLNRSDE